MRALLLAAVLLSWGAVNVSGQAPQTGQQQQSQCVDINTASAKELERIIHIGPDRAQQIITLRQQRRFESVDQLTRVNGIAAARLRDIKGEGLACVRPAQRTREGGMATALRRATKIDANAYAA
jgi:competence ComEA-like helix-hairpin-helix protein